MHRRLQIFNIVSNVLLPRVYTWYQDDVNIFDKNVKELGNLIQIIIIYSQSVRMEFGIEKCALPTTKRKRKNNKTIRTATLEEPKNLWRKRKEDVLGNTESRHYQITRWKKNYGKSTSEERVNFSKPNSAAKILSKDKSFTLVRYLEPFIKMIWGNPNKWTKKQKQKKTSK